MKGKERIGQSAGERMREGERCSSNRIRWAFQLVLFFCFFLPPYATGVCVAGLRVDESRQINLDCIIHCSLHAGIAK